MLAISRKLPTKMLVIEALLRRGVIDADQRKVLDELHWKAERGFEGERRADTFLVDLQLSEPHFLLQGFETKNARGFPHQIDTVLVTNRFILLLEIKNISGTITYDIETNQLIRTWNNQRQALTDPFAQLERHAAFIEGVLWKLGVELPIIHAVVFTSASSILDGMPQQFHIFKLPGLRLKLRDWFKAYPIQIDESMLDLLQREFLILHKPNKWKHPFGQIMIRRGAICLCDKVMKYKQGKFICSCGNQSYEALRQGLHDYRLLLSEWITNRELRQFFYIDSADVANKILKRADFYYEGSTSARRYLIPDDVWRKF
ncbi:nuclease-related domain-containing protein [Lysinibacillus sp. 54212]|uniref:nuclease-related domain-containing protein n=1 Tax=Lysinibacillus sp. 54212 TaxID=3119829 RepID=UPI002FC93D48